MAAADVYEARVRVRRRVLLLTGSCRTSSGIGSSDVNSGHHAADTRARRGATRSRQALVGTA